MILLGERQIPVGVATSTDAHDAESCLRIAGLGNRFHVVVTGDQVENGKPAPDIYLEAARRLNVNPAMCIAVEDSNAGVLAASRAGMRTFMVYDSGLTPSEEARAAAFAVVPTVHDVRRAIVAWLP
jgi:beta-phosphoglucomutase-like phosphatase (HAD superfamily)